MADEIDYTKVISIIMFGGDGLPQHMGDRLKAFVDQEREFAAHMAVTHPLISIAARIRDPYDDPTHVRVDVFVGKKGHTRARAGELIMSKEQADEFLRRIGEEAAL